MRKLVLGVLAALSAVPAFGAGGKAGDFDYYVLSLSWSPSWCAATGDARGDAQCDAGRGYSFTLHGLWPQYESGWPGDCRTSARDPSRGDTAAMADVMGSGGLAWHEWKKHGRCSGLSARDYFSAARQAYGSIRIPDYFSKVRKDLKISATVVEDAFIESNPGLQRNMLTVTCEQGRIAEVRLCLTRDLHPRACGEDTAPECRISDALLPAVR